MKNQFLDTEFEEPRQYLQYAGFWERFLAALIDSIILGIPSVALMHLSPEISGIIGILSLANYLMQPFTERRQTLHDIIARTLVYKND